MKDWPAFRRAADLAGEVFPVSEDVILDAARRIGVGRKLGRVVIFSTEHIHALYEVLRDALGMPAVLGFEEAREARQALVKSRARYTGRQGAVYFIEAGGFVKIGVSNCRSAARSTCSGIPGRRGCGATGIWTRPGWLGPAHGRTESRRLGMSTSW